MRHCAVLLATVVLGWLVAAPAQAAPPEDLDWSATVDGRPTVEATANDPLRLGLTDQSRVVLDLTNRGTTDLTVRSVRLQGRVIGMAFFSYSARLNIVLPAGQSTQRRLDLDVEDVTRQANGLIPAELVLFDADRREIGQKSLLVDVRGSIISVYGLFGLAIAGITTIVVASLFIAIWRRQLPGNRWRRAIRFLPVGIGLGLVLTFTLSATRLLAPSARWWVPFVLLPGAAAFLVGYLLPLGAEDSENEAEEADPTLVRPAP